MIDNSTQYMFRFVAEHQRKAAAVKAREGLKLFCTDSPIEKIWS